MKLLHVENSSGRGGSLKSLMLLWPSPAHWQVEVMSLDRAWSPEIRCDAKVSVIEKQSFVKAWRFLQQGRFDAVHINNALVESWSFVLAAWWEGIPVISHFRSLRPLRKIEYLLSRLCDRLLILSDSHRKILPSFVKSEVLYNPIPDRGRGDNAKNLNIGVFSVLKAGKGHEDLIEALAGVKLDWHLHIVGGSVSDQVSTENALRQLCEKYELSSQVTFHGHVDDPFSLMADCALVVDPSHKAEGFRRTVCEAAMMSKAVLATQVGGAEDLLDSHELVEVQNISAWHQALNTALQDVEALNKRGIELREKAQSMFDVEKTKERFWRLLDELSGVER